MCVEPGEDPNACGLDYRVIVGVEDPQNIDWMRSNLRISDGPGVPTPAMPHIDELPCIIPKLSSCDEIP